MSAVIPMRPFLNRAIKAGISSIWFGPFSKRSFNEGHCLFFADVLFILVEQFMINMLYNSFACHMIITSCKGAKEQRCKFTITAFISSHDKDKVCSALGENHLGRFSCNKLHISHYCSLLRLVL